MSVEPIARTRVPAAERREELIAAAVHEFAHGGLHGTPVERIARRVGVAQPYVFTLFGNKRELFLAALERSFERIAGLFERAAAEYREGRAPADCADALEAMGGAYKDLLASDRDYLMLQHQCYAACDDEVVRTRVRHCYAELVGLAQELSGAEDERIDDFFRHGMALNVAAALGVEDLSSTCAWVQSELAAGAPAAAPGPAPETAPAPAPVPASEAMPAPEPASETVPVPASEAMPAPETAPAPAPVPASEAMPAPEPASETVPVPASE